MTDQGSDDQMINAHHHCWLILRLIKSPDQSFDDPNCFLGGAEGRTDESAVTGAQVWLLQDLKQASMHASLRCVHGQHAHLSKRVWTEYEPPGPICVE